MASLKLFSAIFIVLLAVATATTYTTTVTTITTTEEDEQGSRQCEKEIQRKDLNMCESFLSMEQHGSGSLRMIVQSGEQGQEQEEQLQKQCCQQLQQVHSQCRCAAIEDVVQQQMKGRQSLHSPKMRKVLQKARNLPSACDLEQPQECSFQQPSLFA